MEPMMSLDEKSPGSRPLGRRGRILFVDDEEIICETYSGMLLQLGHEVCTRVNSLAALDEFRATPEQYDLVITDQRMPHLTGLDLADRVKRIRPDISVILCTGYSELITPQTAQDFGIDKIIIKPVGIWQMREVVDSVLG